MRDRNQQISNLLDQSSIPFESTYGSNFPKHLLIEISNLSPSDSRSAESALFFKYLLTIRI